MIEDDPSRRVTFVKWQHLCHAWQRKEQRITLQKWGSLLLKTKEVDNSPIFVLNKQVKRIAHIICSTIFSYFFLFLGSFVKEGMVQKMSSNPIVASYTPSSFQPSFCWTRCLLFFNINEFSLLFWHTLFNLWYMGAIIATSIVICEISIYVYIFIP
jgi:hypothetical protein